MKDVFVWFLGNFWKNGWKNVLGNLIFWNSFNGVNDYYESL